MSDIQFKVALEGSEKIKGDLKKIQGRVTEVSKASDRAAKAFGAMKKALVGITAAAAGLTAIAKSAATMGREVANLSRVAGISSQQFQALAYAAQSVGVEQDKLADIFKDVNDKIGDFMATGAGPMADFFENIGPKVGITAEQFKGLSGPEALGLYISSLEKAGVNQQQMTFYMEALASDSSLLTGLFANNGQQLNQLAGEYQRLGLAIDATKLDTLAQDFQLFGQVMRALGARIGEAVAPVFRALAEALKASLEPGGKLRGVLDGLSAVGEYLSTNMEKVGAVVQKVASYFAAFAALMAGKFAASMGVAAVKAILAAATSLRVLRGALISTGIGALVVALGEGINYMINLSNEVGGLGNAFKIVFSSIKVGWQGVIAKMRTLWAGFMKMIQDGFNFIKKQITEAFTFEISLPQWYKDLTGQDDIRIQGPQFEESTFADGAIAKANEATEAYENAKIAAAALRESLTTTTREGIDVPTTAEPGSAVTPVLEIPKPAEVSAAGQAITTLRTKLDDWRKSMSDSSQQMFDLISNSYNKLEDSLVTFVQTGKMNFKDLMNSMAADLIRFSIRSMAFKIFGNFLGPVPSRMGNAFGASGQLNFANGGVFNQKFALPMGDGRTAIGAESGPEAIMPLQRGKDGRLGVVASGGSGSGGAQVVNNFSTTINPPPNSKPEDARAFAREFNRAVEAKVVETMSKVNNVGIGGRR